MQLIWVERGLWTRFFIRGFTEPVRRPGSTLANFAPLA